MEDLNRIDIAKQELIILINEELKNSALRYKDEDQLTKFLYLAKFGVNYTNIVSLDQYTELWNAVENMDSEIFDFLVLAQTRLFLRFYCEEYNELLKDMCRATSLELLTKPTRGPDTCVIPHALTSKLTSLENKLKLAERNRWIVPLFIISLLDKEVFKNKAIDPP